MNIRIYNSLLVIFPKCYIIGENININKLKEWCKTYVKTPIPEYVPSFETKKQLCINEIKIITNLNMQISDEFNEQLDKMYAKYSEFVHKRLKMVTNKDISIKYVMKKNIKSLYEYIVDNNYPIELNDYYLDKPEKIIFSLEEINRIFFPDILNVNFKKLKLSPSALFSVTYPHEATKITDIIYNIVGNVRIVDACANCGGNTIGFAQKFKKVVSIELEKHNYKALKKNVKEYGFNNVKVFNTDCLEYFARHNYKRNVIFFDPPWGGELIKSKKAVEISLSGIDIDDIINNILEHNKKAKIFMKVPMNFYSKLKHESFRIKNYQLLYFSKDK